MTECVFQLLPRERPAPADAPVRLEAFDAMRSLPRTG
jgi:hypothetical protein